MNPTFSLVQLFLWGKKAEFLYLTIVNVTFIFLFFDLFRFTHIFAEPNKKNNQYEKNPICSNGVCITSWMQDQQNY